MERVDYETLIVQEVINRRNDELDLSPWYQRRSVWSDPQRSYLINTVFERKPIPSLYLRQSVDVDTGTVKKEVVDGQQRLRTILSYRDGDFAAKHPARDRKVHFDELSRSEKSHFLQSPLSVGYLIDASDSDVVEIFGRINSVAKTLNPQEKRNALYGGEFKQFSLEYAASLVPFWRQSEIFSAREISRMQEVQFISELAINLIEGLTDFNATKINAYYRRYDESFDEGTSIRERMDEIFALLTDIDPSNFRDSVFQKYQNSFSLMLVIDEFAEHLDSQQVEEAIQEVDALVEDGAGDEVSEAFTGGNLHRIRKRRVRHDVLSDALG